MTTTTAPTTLQEMIGALAEPGERLALIAMTKQGRHDWSYTALSDTVQRLASGLLAAGLQPGERVVILAKNSPEWLFSCLAVIYAGGVVIPLDNQLKGAPLAAVFASSTPSFVFTTTNYVRHLSDDSIAYDGQVYLFDVADDDPRSWRTLLHPTTIAPPTVQPDDTATMFFTSGTTGTPKGVPLTHANFTFQLQAVLAVQIASDQDRMVQPLPMYHVYPFTVGLLCAFAYRMVLVLPQSIAGGHIVQALQEGKGTILVGVPRLYRAIYEKVDNNTQSRGPVVMQAFQRMLATSIWLRRTANVNVGRRLFGSVHQQVAPSLRLLLSGGSALDADLAWKLAGLGWDIAIGYGLTETSPLLTMNIPGNEPPILTAVGKPLPGLEMKIDRDYEREEGTQPGHSGEGEVLARGGSVFRGYYNLPDQTAKVLSNDGWFRTGDLGYFDDKGNLYISGRASTLIVTEGGKNIQPEPVEEAYQQHRFISEIGLLQDGNKLAALIVPNMDEVNRWRNGDVPRAIREAVSTQGSNLPSYQRINTYQITHEPLPKTNLGKIRRHLLKESYAHAKQGGGDGSAGGSGRVGLQPTSEMSDTDRALLENPVVQQVWQLLGTRFEGYRISPDTHLQGDLGIDSLEWLNLTADIGSAVSVELGESETRSLETIRDLLQAIARHSTGGTPAPQSDSLQQLSETLRTDPESLLTEEQRTWLQPQNTALEMGGVIGFALNKTFNQAYLKVTAHGVDNLPSRRPFILAPNHNSNLDPYVIASSLPYEVLRYTYWAGSIDMFYSNAAMRTFSRASRVLPVAGAGSIDVTSSLAFAAAALHRGFNLVWFPEGRLSPNGELLPFRQGLGIVLTHYPVPVVPVYITGTFVAMPRGQFLPKSHPVSVTFGAPCDPHELEQSGAGKYPHARIVSALHQRMLALTAEASTPDPATSS